MRKIYFGMLGLKKESPLLLHLYYFLHFVILGVVLGSICFDVKCFLENDFGTNDFGVKYTTTKHNKRNRIRKDEGGGERQK